MKSVTLKIIEKPKNNSQKGKKKIKPELEEQKKSSKSKSQAQFNEDFEISDENIDRSID